VEKEQITTCQQKERLTNIQMLFSVFGDENDKPETQKRGG
jgi:hypothetical protein